MRKPRRLQTRTVAVFLLIAFSGAYGRGAYAQNNTVETPAQGSPERKSVLDAVRARLKLKSQFKVYHLKLSGNWAYFHGGEVMEAGEGELQETDLDVKALLERKPVGGKPAWVVAEIWTLPTDARLPYRSFVTRTRRRQKASNISAGIFPADM
ncbi:MAG TPA: hypothetical protein VGB05_07695 [Pyrinomonadaceae bacterium]|jgi:hypothetical protein